MNEVLLSFVVPVYNVETYLRKCLQSIIEQWSHECEMILVDDGSTDSSGRICDIFGKQYKNIRVIHKKNGGLSSARNAGLELANGKYISFIDSDDYIALNCLSGIIRWVKENNVDICFMDAVKVYPEGKIRPMGDCIKRKGVRGKERKEVVKYLASRPKFPGSACTKIYNLSFLRENHICFPPDRRLSEDLGFCRTCYLKANSFDVQTIPFYRYRQGRNGSITNETSIKTLEGILVFINESIEELTSNKKPKDMLSEYILSFAAYEYMVLLFNYSKATEENKRSVIDELEEKKWVLVFGRNLKTIVCRNIVKLFGVQATARILKALYEFRYYFG